VVQILPVVQIPHQRRFGEFAKALLKFGIEAIAAPEPLVGLACFEPEVENVLVLLSEH
jgi:hypothetical protein